MDVFSLRRDLISEYQKYIQGFVRIRDDRISSKVEEEIREGWLWPAPLIQLNPSFEPGESLQNLVEKGILGIRYDLYQGKGFQALVSQDSTGDLPALDIPLHQNLFIILEGGLESF